MPRRMFKYRLYPSKTQIETLEEHLELCRLIYNLLLDYCKQQYKKNGRTPSQFDLNNLLVPLKKVSPEFSVVFSQVLRNVSKRIKDNYENFFARRRTGLKAGLPRFKKQGRYKSITYPQKGFKIKGNRLYLSKIGNILMKQHREIEGQIKTLTVKRMPSGKWYAYFSCILETRPKIKPFEAVGIDVGLNNYAVLSDGTQIENPRFHKKEERRLARLQKRASKKKTGSRNREKAKIKVNRLYEKIRNRRTDFLHKTSRKIADDYNIICVENLQIYKMRQNSYVAKSVSDASWGEFIRMLYYKAEGAGGKVVSVNPMNTSQECSKCGNMVKKSLFNRVHMCPACGLVMDRDLNAALNILARGREIGRESPEYMPAKSLTTTHPFGAVQVNLMKQEALFTMKRGNSLPNCELNEVY